jgi:F-type H+-transporting ATPase subunit epsilon
MHLKIVSPVKTYFSGEVTLITLPGVSGTFTLLENHAPLISVLGEGAIVYKQTATNDQIIKIAGGFAEVNNNQVTVCVENVL